MCDGKRINSSVIIWETLFLIMIKSFEKKKKKKKEKLVQLTDQRRILWQGVQNFCKCTIHLNVMEWFRLSDNSSGSIAWCHFFFCVAHSKTSLIASSSQQRLSHWPIFTVLERLWFHWYELKATWLFIEICFLHLI